MAHCEQAFAQSLDPATEPGFARTGVSLQCSAPGQTDAKNSSVSLKSMANIANICYSLKLAFSMDNAVITMNISLPVQIAKLGPGTD